ncbi:hypothetical protein [Parasitella parasitica]|uniref:Uncharacterized protein n=1 Tax=Parasitella parasitica TaxID=35722 RepID=A0A0B7NK42_9FUNG|nr:hypothetical protein [Parasitella parasitica]
MSTTLLKQQKINSLRRKDKMWIYKNPQGLLILENELNERRQKRSARHRSTVLEVNRQDEQKLENNKKTVLTPSAMKVESPKDILIPLAKKTGLDSKPANIFIEKPLKKTTTDKSSNTTTEINKESLQTGIKKNSIEERSKLFKSYNNSNNISPRDTLKSASTTTSKSKQTAKPLRDKPTILKQDKSFLQEAKQKLSSVQQKASKNSEPDSSVPPPRRKGLVSSFVSAFETSPPDLLTSSQKTNLNRADFSKSKTLAEVNPTASQSYSHAFPSRLASRSSQQSMRPTEHSVLPSPTTTVSSPALSTPSTTTVSAVSYFPTVATKPEEIKNSSIKRGQAISPSSEINIYLPQLSPEISFHHKNPDMLDDISAGEEEESEANDNGNEPLDKKVASVLPRPVIKKQVSFSKQLLTYIPEQQSGSEDDASSYASESPKSPVSDLSKTLTHELTDAESRLIANRKVNDAMLRDKFVPAVTSRVDPRASLANAHTPKKLSNKLLGMFQQTLSNPSIKQQQAQTSKPSPHPQQPGKLVHLTASRPRKPSSLKKHTYPATTTQSDLRA